MNAQLAPGYDPRHWTTADGRRHTSVPTAVPTAWKQKHDDSGLVYISGAYSIHRTRYGRGWLYGIARDGVELRCSYSRLRDAKDRAVNNARGRDVVNVA